MNEQMKRIVPLLCMAALLGACGATGGGQKSAGGTHTLTGGAEAAPTSEATPQPARPRGDTGAGSRGGMPGAPPGGAQGGTQGGGMQEGSQGGGQSSSGQSGGGDTTTGGAEAMPTREGTPQGGGASGPGTGGSGPGATQPPRQ